MSNGVNYRVYPSAGAFHEPTLNETVWDWALRVRDHGLINMGTATMELMWTHVQLRCHSADLHSLEGINNDSEHPLIVMYDDGLAMSWGKYVFFTSEAELVVFKLLFSKYIKSCVIIERQYHVA